MIRARLRWTLFSLILFPLVAQAQERLPETRELERLGLTQAWWARAVVDPGQDVIEFLQSDEQHVIAQSRDGLLTVFRADTGRVEWSALVGRSSIRTYPAKTNNDEIIVCVGSKMISLDRYTGETRWELKLPNHPSCAPDVDDQHVYFGAIDGSAYAYDLKKIRELYGERKLPAYSKSALVWRFKTPQDVISIKSSGTYVAFVSRIGSLYGVDAVESKLRYQLETNEPVETALGVSSDSVFVCSRDARMLSLTLNSGQLRWAFTSGTQITRQPRIIGNDVFVTPIHYGLFCLDSEDGGEKWRQLDAREFLAASDAHVYGADAMGNMLVMDRGTGRVTGRLETRHLKIHSPNELTDRIYFGTTTGLVACFRERQSSLPVFHRHPERRPIMPEFAPEAGEANVEAEETPAAETSN